MTNGRILALDLGKASIGLCLRDNETIHKLESYIIPPDFATVQDLRPRKHAARNRKAHKHRERWFMEAIWLKAGMPDYREPETWERLKANLPTCYDRDKKLWTREFPKKSDNTCFNSALLRIQLLEGKPLADWQIWKALWSALQQRGFYYYDWKTEPAGLDSIEGNIAGMEQERQQLEAQIDELKEQKKVAKGDEKNELADLLSQQQAELKAWKAEYADLIEQLKHYDKVLTTAVSLDKYRYPCYLDAFKQGLWQLNTETYTAVISNRLGANAEALKPEEQQVPRAYRLKELKALWQQAQQQLPQLQAFDVNYFLYGETRLPYATAWKDEYKAFRGKEKYDWQGVLGQKVPRFDNRIIAKCQLLPSRNVCKASDPLNLKFSLLTQLKNLRYMGRDNNVHSLAPQELRQVFTQLWNTKIKEQLARNNGEFGIAHTVLVKVLKDEVDAFERLHNLGHREKLKLNASGRSRFSRPALHLMTSALLQAENAEATPAQYMDATFYAQPDKPNGLTQIEVENALKRLGKTWTAFQVLDRRYELNEPTARENALNELLASSNNPIVRHRLTVLRNLLDDLDAEFNLKNQPPEKVILEFVRGVDSGFEGKKAAEDYSRAISNNEKLNDALREKLAEINLTPTKTNVIKLKLFNEQKGQCVYTGEKLEESELNYYQIEHIVPISEELHSDALWNKVLTTVETNRIKAKRTPYAWLKETAGWPDYLARVQAIYAEGHKKKKRLLTEANAKDLVESYNGLAETSYIARLTRQMLALYFGYPDQTEGDNRQIFVNDGAMTGAIRRRYDLNSWLLTQEQALELEKLLYQQREYGEAALPQEKQAWAKRIKELGKKQRTNDKHHALDAFCVSFSLPPDLERYAPSELYPEGYWHIPAMERFKPQAKAMLDDLFPTPLRRNTKELYPEETIYRYNAKHNAMTVRKSILAFLENDKDGKAIGKIVDQPLRHYLERKRLELTDKAAWRDFLDPERFAKTDEDPQHVECRHPNFGSIVKKVEVIASELKAAPTLASDGKRVAGEYKDYGDKATKGQFKRTKQHKGQLLYRDFTGKWKVFPVYGYMRLAEARKQAQAKGQLYQDGMLFYSSATLVLPETAKGGAVPAGSYKLRTIMSTGFAKLEGDNGQDFLISVADITSVRAQVLKQ